MVTKILLSTRRADPKIILSMRKRQFKRYTREKYVLPIKDFCFSIYYGSNPILYARGIWKKEYEDIELVFRSTDLAISARDSVVKSLGWNKDVVYTGGKISIISSAHPSISNIYGIFNSERDMLKFKLRN